MGDHPDNISVEATHMNVYDHELGDWPNEDAAVQAVIEAAREEHRLLADIDLRSNGRNW